MRNGVILIPALNPPASLTDYVQGLIRQGFEAVIIIDDGSGPEYQAIFEKIGKWKECRILKHAVNMGKGRALKNGFNHYLNTCGNYKGVITVDSDGQHLIENVIEMDKALKGSGGGLKLILGSRDFGKAGIPFRSRFGNKLTSKMFRWLYGMKIADTQTGLRSFTNDVLHYFVTLPGERFEYETNMLLEAKRRGIVVEEVPIETVYNNQNKGSHFHPVRDCVRIYVLLLKEFVRFVMVSLSSFAADIALFHMFGAVLSGNSLSVQIYGATIGARMISSLYNCMLNRCVVFKSHAPVKQAVVKYYALCAAQMLCSAGIVFAICRRRPVSRLLVKACADTALFFLSYRIQRDYVYREDAVR